MWRNPNHPAPSQAKAPQETGERVATFERHGGEELRVCLAEYEGHRYLSLRVWSKGQDGQLWPVKGKGLSVKLREVAGLAEAFADVAGRLGADEVPRPDRRQAEPGPRRGTARPPFDPGRVAPKYLVGFDECDDGGSTGAPNGDEPR